MYFLVAALWHTFKQHAGSHLRKGHSCERVHEMDEFGKYCVTVTYTHMQAGTAQYLLNRLNEDKDGTEILENGETSQVPDIVDTSAHLQV